MTQCEVLLEAFQRRKTLTTAQLRKDFYIANPNARISQLKRRGHVIVGTKIGGKTTQWKFEYLGFTPNVITVTSDKETLSGIATWHKLPNNFEVQYVG